ncbi:MAG: hypothetical protein AAF215_12535 [Cyanobacteria bacterium P01_A01_bin.123]
MSFIPDTETYNLPPSPANQPTPTREPIRIILIGSIHGISLIISILHRLGFAEPRAWSKPQLDPASGKPMCVLTKWFHHRQ